MVNAIYVSIEDPQLTAVRHENAALRAQLQNLPDACTSATEAVPNQRFEGPSTDLSPADKTRRNAE